MANVRQVVMQIEAKNLIWEGYHDPKSNMWVGVCNALNLNALGETWDELQQCANDAMATLFLDLFKTGELADFLRANNWRQVGATPAPGQVVRFDVPADWKRSARFDGLVNA